MGLPVLHSVSPQMHNAALKAAGLNGVYLPFPVRDATEFLRRMVHPRTREMDWNIRGVSVTAPYKSTVIDALDWIEPTAAELGAINTIVVEGDQLRGYNTDILAFIQTLVASFGELPNARCAVMGAGGAARAVIWGLKQTTTNVTVFGRNELQAKTLARELEVDYRSFSEARFDEFDLVINATTLGTAGELESQTPARAAQLAGARLACDLVYNPEETLFLREARAAGCQTLGGLPMLVRQAIAQFKLWTGIEAGEKGHVAGCPTSISSKYEVTIGKSSGTNPERYSRQILFKGIRPEGTPGWGHPGPARWCRAFRPLPQNLGAPGGGNLPSGNRNSFNRQTSKGKQVSRKKTPPKYF